MLEGKQNKQKTKTKPKPKKEEEEEIKKELPLLHPFTT